MKTHRTPIVHRLRVVDTVTVLAKRLDRPTRPTTGLVQVGGTARMIHCRKREPFIRCKNAAARSIEASYAYYTSHGE